MFAPHSFILCGGIPKASQVNNGKRKWSRSGKVEWLQGAEPVWHQVRAGSEITQESISVDELVDDLRLDRLDWIKLDIEGVEVEALRGTARTVRIYHRKLSSKSTGGE